MLFNFYHEQVSSCSSNLEAARRAISNLFEFSWCQAHRSSASSDGLGSRRTIYPERHDWRNPTGHRLQATATVSGNRCSDLRA